MAAVGCHTSDCVPVSEPEVTNEPEVVAKAEVDEAATVRATVVEVPVVMLNERNCMLELAAGDRIEHGVVVACPVDQTVVVAHPAVFAKVERG